MNFYQLIRSLGVIKLFGVTTLSGLGLLICYHVEGQRPQNEQGQHLRRVFHLPRVALAGIHHHASKKLLPASQAHWRDQILDRDNCHRFLDARRIAHDQGRRRRQQDQYLLGVDCLSRVALAGQYYLH